MTASVKGSQSSQNVQPIQLAEVTKPTTKTTTTQKAGGFESAPNFQAIQIAPRSFEGHVLAKASGSEASNGFVKVNGKKKKTSGSSDKKPGSTAEKKPSSTPNKKPSSITKKKNDGGVSSYKEALKHYDQAKKHEDKALEHAGKAVDHILKGELGSGTKEIIKEFDELDKAKTAREVGSGYVDRANKESAEYEADKK